MADGDNDAPKTNAAPGADPETSLKAMVKLIHGREAEAKGVPTDKFIAFSKALQQSSEKAAAQGYNAVAAETMAIVNRQTRIRLRTILPAEEAGALRELEDSVTTAEGAFLESGIQETIAALSISDEELAQRRATNPNYSEAGTERRLLAILDEYFYHALKKGTLLTDWPAKLEAISSFDPDLAAQAASQFFFAPQASVGSAEEFNQITAAAEKACAEASAKGYFASAARTMADILVQIRANTKALAGNEQMLSILRPAGDDAVGKFNTIMTAWATVAFAHPNDPRSPEQVHTAETAIQEFVHSLRTEGFNMGGNPPPAPAAS